MTSNELHFEPYTKFTIEGDHSVMRGLATVGKFTTGEDCPTSLALGTSDGKVLIITPTAAGDRDITQLNMHKKITALTTWVTTPHDLLCIATSSSLSVFDVERNSDFFYREMPDGVSALSVADGLPGSSPTEGGGSVLFAGGDCNIRGFDRGGGEVFWTITGDRVMALDSLKPAEDSPQQLPTSVLICGTDDYQIRILAGEAEVVADITEADAVCHLVSLDHRHRFGYGLVNGTVGVYEGSRRLWRVRSRHAPSCLLAFTPHTEDSKHSRKELAIGWMNGLVEVRRQSNGEVIFKTRTGQDPLAAVLSMDYIGSPVPVLMAIDIEGRVHAWMPQSVGAPPQGESPHTPAQANVGEQLSSEMPVDEAPVLDKAQVSRVPASSDAGPLTVELFTTPAGVVLRLAVPMGVIMKVIMTAEGLFGPDGHVVKPEPPAKRIEVNVPISKDVGTLLNIKCLTGVTKASREYTVLEAHAQPPKFAMYHFVGPSLEGQSVPTGSVSFRMTENIDKFRTWVQESFYLGDRSATVTEGALQVAFLPCRRPEEREASSGLEISVSSDGSVCISTDSMQLAADLIQHLCDVMSVKELESVCSFPKTMVNVQEAMQLIEEYDNLRQKMSADTAESAQTVKGLLVRMEDLRLCDYTLEMRKTMVFLQKLSRGMIADHNKRRNNHGMLLDALRGLNLLINRGASLRVGRAQAAVIAECKKAIKNKDAATLVGVISQGGYLGPSA